ncbi:MAG: TAXI family TRAP transporter solute-binding subunit [Dehalobacterium sp.]
MFRKKWLVVFLVLIYCAVLITGCTGDKTPNESGDKSGETVENQPSASGGGNRLVLGAAGSGGTFYVWGAGWSSVINTRMSNYDVSVQVTGGPEQNCQLLHQGDIQLGFSTAFVAGDAYKGVTTEEPYTDLRALFPMYSSFLHVFTLADTGINSLIDFKGKHIATGTPGGSSEIVGNKIIEVLNLQPREVSPLALSAVIDGMRDGQIDAGFAVSALPVPSLVELETTHKINYIQMTDTEIDKIMANGSYTLGTIPAGTYKNQDNDIKTLTFWTLCLTNDKLSDDQAYDLTKATFENVSAIGESVGNVKEVIAKNILNSPVPIHPGAARYYKEIGIDIPNTLLP